MENRIRVAHANFKKGLHDYNDGSLLNHNLGNDDYKDGCNLPDEDNLLTFDGTEALGNLIDEGEEEEDEEERV